MARHRCTDHSCLSPGWAVGSAGRPGRNVVVMPRCQEFPLRLASTARLELVAPAADGPNFDVGVLVADRYRLAELVGRLATGTVWRAHDELLHRDVAVKRFRGRRSHSIVEARLAATHYIAIEGRSPFLREEAVPTLAAVLHDAPSPARPAGRLEPLLTRLLVKDPADGPPATSFTLCSPRAIPRSHRRHRPPGLGGGVRVAMRDVRVAPICARQRAEE